MQLLRVDSSARRGAVSRQLTDRFIARWRAMRPDTTVIERNLAATPLPHITDEWSATSDTLIDEILDADLMVIGAPMYNFTISWPLKAWIDQIVRLHRTVTYEQGAPKGLLHDIPVVVLTARGSSYGSGPGDFQEPYLRHILGFIGLTAVTFVHAEYQYRRERSAPALAAALDQIDRLTQEMASATPHTH